MRFSQMIGRTLKETPRDAELASHRFLLRAGYIRQYSAGVYALLPLAVRCLAKIERVCREEMNRQGGQEVRLPCLATKELWSETGRYQTFGRDMFKLQDRNEKQMVLNPTHEEPVVDLARNELTSYRQLPMMLYQIQTKFRDEPRPRGGLVRLREFTMKDAYSFHASEEDLKAYYDNMHAAYMRFYKRLGCRNFVSVISDNGVFGGRYSHEFQMLVPTGEDKLMTCPSCRYSANQEIATSPFVFGQIDAENREKPMTKIATPGQSTIESLVRFLGISPEHTAKAVLFETAAGEPVVTFVRGDLEVLSTKVRTLVGAEVTIASKQAVQKAGAVVGSTGPVGLNLDACHAVVFDKTIVQENSFVTGANESDFHYAHFQLRRDFLDKIAQHHHEKVIVADIAGVRVGDPCPECGSALVETRGIEIGNIFHLGTKYTQSMGSVFLDQQGKKQIPIMGCYGIGITRLLSAIIEESHDDKGLVLPLPVAPFEVHLCVLNRKEEQVLSVSEDLYKNLTQLGLEVLLDDRDEKAGSQFADADLIGIPFCVVVSPKTLAEGCFELKYRDRRSLPQKIPCENLIQVLTEEINAESKKFAVFGE